MEPYFGLLQSCSQTFGFVHNCSRNGSQTGHACWISDVKDRKSRTHISRNADANRSISAFACAPKACTSEKTPCKVRKW